MSEQCSLIRSIVFMPADSPCKGAAYFVTRLPHNETEIGGVINISRSGGYFVTCGSGNQRPARDLEERLLAEASQLGEREFARKKLQREKKAINALPRMRSHG